MEKLVTKSGKNFWEIASLIQKAVRRADYNRAGYCANELIDRYGQYLWRKLFVISAEDCFGAVTHEIVTLRKESWKNRQQNKELVSKAVMILCQCRKSKDADYFDCNYFHSEEKMADDAIWEYACFDDEFTLFGRMDKSQLVKSKNGHSVDDLAVMLRGAIRGNRYADAGYAANELMEANNGFLWEILARISILDYGEELTDEIDALHEADEAQRERENIFASKAIVLLCQSNCEHERGFFEWNYDKVAKVIPEDVIDSYSIEKCILPENVMPDWTYSWHTSKGKRMGRDCVDSIIDDQLALTPLQKALFDEEDWSYHIKHTLPKHNPKHRAYVGIDWKNING